MDIGLGEHRVVLELTLAERRGVASDDNQLGLARSKAFQGGLVAESDCKYVRFLLALTPKAVENNQPLPDFITSARRELMESEVFFAFFGAIVALYC